MTTAAASFAKVLRWAQTEADVERIMQLCAIASLREEWHQLECMEVAEAGRERVRQLRARVEGRN